MTPWRSTYTVAAVALLLLLAGTSSAHGPGDPTGLLVSISDLLPDEWCAICLTMENEPGTPGRPETKTGENVYILRVKDSDREIVIPWPEGMTATEALLHWKDSPVWGMTMSPTPTVVIGR